MPNAQVSPALVRVVIIVILGVGGYMLWTGMDSFRRHPLASADTVRTELLAITDPPGMTVTRDLKVIDRGTFIYAQKYYQASDMPSAITARYAAQFVKNGWRQVGGASGRDFASSFCKNKLLGNVYFYRVEPEISAFSVTVTTGGPSIDVCG